MVGEIVDRVRRDGDTAVREFTHRFDRCEDALSSDWGFRVEPAAMLSAWERIDVSLQNVLKSARDRIWKFHEAQRPMDIELRGETDEVVGLAWRAIERVGVYVPGGRAAYPSSVLMNVIPAQVAGVTDIVLVSPPNPETSDPHDLVLAAAHLLGVQHVYRIGGAQAIAALAYGTEQIHAVDKIVGPGNRYVALAKRCVMGDVGIDSIAGPTEVFVVADKSANPDFVAADLIAQAEHDPEASAVCITTSDRLADQVDQAVVRRLKYLPKADIARVALENNGAIVVVESLQDAFKLVNIAAPEHVELQVENAMDYLKDIRTAGAVFLGPFTPEPVGDYYAGTNHVLPTFGSARFASGLGVHDFLRRMSFVEYNERTLRAHQHDIIRLANAEGLSGHAQSISIRFEGVNRND